MKLPRILIRTWITIAIMLVVLGIFVARLMNIQIVEGETYKKMQDGRYISTQTVKATRGEIVDRNGNPLAVNRMGYDVILDKAYLPADRQNEIILQLIGLFERLGEKWTDNLPITEAPFAFLPEQENEIARLKKLVDVQSFATAENAFHWLVGRYSLADYSPEDQRKIAGVRYEMEQRGFTWNVPYTFATDIDISSVIQIKERSHQLQGVDVVESAVRNYPDGTLAPHLIGTIGPIYAEEYEELEQKGYMMDDSVGKSGVEKAFEDLLRGRNGQRQIHIGAGGEVVQAVENEAPVPGNTVVLTLDNDLQALAQQALERQIKKLNDTAIAGRGKEADTGAAVAVKVKTGEVLLAATYPSYDLNTFTQDYSALAADTELRPLFNRAVQGVYAPGSTFKPTVGLTGLAHGIVEEGSTVVCGGRYTFYAPGYQPTCLDAHGSVNILNALRVSCNIYFYDVGRRVGIDNIVSMAAQLGLGQPTGVEVPEALGQISSPAAKAADPANDEPWFPGDVLQSSIGQMYNWYTPLQLANYAATIGNRGKRMKLTLVHEVRDYSLNEVTQSFKPEVAEVVDAPAEAFETVIKGMILASGPSGTALEFNNYPITVASKTGTPETRDLPNSVFICFAPAEDPEIAICIVIEKGWHGYTGAPVAKEILNAYFGFDQSGAAAAQQNSASGNMEGTQSESESAEEPVSQQPYSN